jgi:hypothetical protein
MDKVIHITPNDASGQLTSLINGPAQKAVPVAGTFFPRTHYEGYSRMQRQILILRAA